jgi:hypothetical protein
VHGRRQLLWFEVTRYPTAEWLARQITEAFPWASAPAYLVRLPDCGHKLRNTSQDSAANCETKFRCDEVGPKQARGKLVSKSVAFPPPPDHHSDRLI